MRQPQGVRGPAPGAPSHERKNNAGALFAAVVVLVMAAMIWGPMGKIWDAREDRTTAPFPHVNFPPLIEGTGLDDGSTTIPWPADFGVSAPGNIRGEGVGADVRSEVQPLAPSGKNSNAAVGPHLGRPAVDTAGGPFGALDLNDDGRMSPAEFAVYRAASLQPNEKGAKADDMPPYVATRELNITIGKLRELDKDNDWFLSRPEFAAAVRSPS